MLLFTARAGREEDGRAVIMVKEEEEGYSGWLRGHHGRLESVGECKSFPTGAMKLRRIKYFISLSEF